MRVAFVTTTAFSLLVMLATTAVAAPLPSEHDPRHLYPKEYIGQHVRDDWTHRVVGYSTDGKGPAIHTSHVDVPATGTCYVHGEYLDHNGNTRASYKTKYVDGRCRGTFF